MAVETPRESYVDARLAWDVVRDAASGEMAVKKSSTKYLPMPSGFTSQADGGARMFNAYLDRASFPEIVAPSARGMVGMVHRVPAKITLPEKLEPMRARATRDGVSLADLHERITNEVLLTGRYGLLADVPEDGDAVPYIAGYSAESIVNWAPDGSFFMLDETHEELDSNFEWQPAKQFRELRLEDGVYTVRIYTGEALEADREVIPQGERGAKLTEIPFTVVGSTDIAPGVDEVPILPVARAALAAYRLDADYRHQLFHSGQSTLFISNAPDELPKVVGSGVIVGLPDGAEAKYVSPDGATIEAHRRAIQDELEKAMAAGGRLLETERKSAESGEAIKRRMISQTASLVTIALNSSKGLEKALKHCAMYVGADPEEVSVEPNLSFVESGLTASESKALLELWMAGAISKRTLYENLQQGEIASHEREFEDEQELIEQEAEIANADDQ